MKVEILTTPGCSNCKVLEQMLDNMGVPYEMIDVTLRPDYLEKYPIFMAPGLVIDGKLESTGIPRIDDLKKLLS